MRWLRRAGTGWPLLAGALVLAVCLTAIGAVSVGSSPSRQISSTGIAAAGVVAPGTLADPTTTTQPAPPAPTSTTRPPPTTPSTVVQAVPTTRPTVPVAISPPTVPPRVAATPGSADAYPSSWSLETNGVSIHLRMEPAHPHLGDTVTLYIESSATVATDYCCLVNVYVGAGMETVYQRMGGGGPCPAVQGPIADRATFVGGQRGVLGFRVQASRVMMCSPPPQFATANLDASTWVLSPGE